MSLKNKFHEQKTGVIYPKMAWNKANARLDAEQCAMTYLLTHKEKIIDQGITNAAAAMYVTNKREINFSIYDRENQDPNDVTPQDTYSLRPVTPYSI